jgi:hypothetical protein
MQREERGHKSTRPNPAGQLPEQQKEQNRVRDVEAKTGQVMPARKFSVLTRAFS